MLDTLTTLSQAATARNTALPVWLQKNPVRAWALEGLRKRNAALDGLFYDVQVIEEDEARELAFWLAHEGAIVVAPPSHTRKVTVYADAAQFMASSDAAAVSALVVAGVGSSALGAAALARNIADARGETVAAVVSGYGFADLPTEALGGWFFFGALNSVRHAFEGLDAWSRMFERAGEGVDPAVGLVRMSKDTLTLIALLGDPAFDAKLLVGHSKGNLVISEALYWLAERDPERAATLGQSAAVVTLCAKIRMPDAFHKVIDVTGEYDSFGAMNSRQDIPSDYVAPHAWHSTNREFPFGLGLDVGKAMAAIAPMLDAPAANRPKARPSELATPQLAVSLLPG